MAGERDVHFDPIGMLAVLQEHHVSFVVIGAFARVIQGTDELTRGVDVAPSAKPANLRLLAPALAALDARRTDGQPLVLESDEPILELATNRGSLKVVAEPLGTRGYDDLRRAAAREALGSGVRVQVASVGDLIRMAGAYATERSMTGAQQLRHIAELERELGVSRSL